MAMLKWNKNVMYLLHADFHPCGTLSVATFILISKKPSQFLDMLSVPDAPKTFQLPVFKVEVDIENIDVLVEFLWQHGSCPRKSGNILK